MSQETTSTRRTRGVVAAAALYFVMVFAVGFALGPVRVLWLEPVLGKTIAVLIESPALVVAMIFAARLAPRWTRMRGNWAAYVTVGVLALVFQQIADLAVGFGLRGMTLNDQAAYFATPPGYIYLATLVIFAIMPLAVRRKAEAIEPDQQSGAPKP